MKEQSKLFGLRQHNGNVEVISNDGEILIILHKIRSIENGNVAESYLAQYYVKENGGWIETIHEQNYSSEAGFISKLRTVHDFSKALMDLDNCSTNTTD